MDARDLFHTNNDKNDKNDNNDEQNNEDNKDNEDNKEKKSHITVPEKALVLPSFSLPFLPPFAYFSLRLCM